MFYGFVDFIGLTLILCLDLRGIPDGRGGQGETDSNTSLHVWQALTLSSVGLRHLRVTEGGG